MDKVYEAFISLRTIRIPQRVIVPLNCLLSAANIGLKFIVWIGVILWVIYNKKHLKVYDNYDSTVGFSVKEAVYTNFSVNDFNTIYVKPEEFENYNQVWDYSDYVFKYPTEVQVMTNMAITVNQTQSICPSYPMFRGVLCHDDSQCEEGLARPGGVQTGKCVNADFPYRDDFNNWSNVTVCEIRGWCKSSRYLPPLKNFTAVLGKTINNTLWLKNTVIFQYKKIKVDNEFGNDLTYFLKCRYNPVTDPHCPVFILGDIIKFTQNAGQTYDEIAKWGAVINIEIIWKCYIGFNKDFDPNSCKPEYSFTRIDDNYENATTGPTGYRYAHYYNNGKTRTTIRSYRIRFVTSVNAKITKFDFYNFLTNTLAYKGAYDLCMLIFIWRVRKLYPDIDQVIQVNGYQQIVNN